MCGGSYGPLPDCANCPDCYAASKKRSLETPVGRPSTRLPSRCCLQQHPPTQPSNAIRPPVTSPPVPTPRSAETRTESQVWKMVDSHVLREYRAVTTPLCDLPGCADADVCRENMRQRRRTQGETSCDCSDHHTMCACAIK